MNIELLLLYEDLINWNLSFGVPVEDTISELDIKDEEKEELKKLYFFF
jgi:hypothetical protein